MASDTSSALQPQKSPALANPPSPPPCAPRTQSDVSIMTSSALARPLLAEESAPDLLNQEKVKFPAVPAPHMLQSPRQFVVHCYTMPPSCSLQDGRSCSKMPLEIQTAPSHSTEATNALQPCTVTVGGQQVSMGDACIGTSHAPAPCVGHVTEDPEIPSVSPSVLPCVSKSPVSCTGDNSDDMANAPFEGGVLCSDRSQMGADSTISKNTQRDEGHSNASNAWHSCTSPTSAQLCTPRTGQAPYLRNSPNSSSANACSDRSPDTVIRQWLGLSPSASEPIKRPPGCCKEAESSPSLMSEADVHNADILEGRTRSIHASHAPESNCGTNTLVLRVAEATVLDALASSRGVKRGHLRESGYQCDHALDNALPESRTMHC